MGSPEAVMKTNGGGHGTSPNIKGGGPLPLSSPAYSEWASRRHPTFGIWIPSHGCFLVGAPETAQP